MSTIQSDLLLGQEGGAGYGISRSLRFNSSDSAYLSRTPSTAGNRKTWTWAGWVKRSGLGSDQFIFSAGVDASNRTIVYFRSDDRLELINYVAGTITGRRQTTPQYRDPSAWLHITVVWDSANATATSRIRIYVNGSEVTAFSSTGDPSSADSQFNSTAAHSIGRDQTGGSSYFSGYLADIHFIDGQALTPSSFTEVSATTGRLEPKAYSGPAPTGNSFWLPFSDNSAATATTLGKDNFNLGNNWSCNNVSVADGTVATSTGALPIHNTTDSYGNTKGSGTRTDANSSSIVLAVPMDGANNGTSFADLSATIKGSGSAKTITTVGDAKTSTSRSRYYGSSGLFDGAGDYLSVAASSDLQLGSGDFCIEMWWHPTSTARQALYHGSIGTDWSIGIDYSSVGTQKLGIWASANGSSWNMLNADGGGNGIGTITVPQNQWNHIAYTRSGNTFRLFVNGVQDVAVTASGTIVDRSGSAAAIGSWWSTGAMLQATGSLQDFRVYKGVAKYTASFSVPNYLTGAGNDSLVDTPTSGSQVDTGLGGQVTGNYATLNPLHSDVSLASNGNLDCNSNGSGWIGSTVHVASGKWYVEFTVGSTGTVQMFGVCASTHSGSGYPWLASPNVTYYVQDGRIYVDGTNTGATTGATAGDIISLSFDVDAKSVVIRKNNSILSTKTVGTTSSYMFFISDGGGSATSSVNFGQRPFAYTAPSGFKALCDTNLPAPVVAKPSTAMDVKLYTGNGSTQTISGLGFSPDLVWIKDRSLGASHLLHDEVRGAGKTLFSNLTIAETTNYSYGYLSAFTSNGFTVQGGSSGNDINSSSQTYAAWCWDAGSTTVTNTQGSITSSVRANPSAGFSVVTYTGTGANATVGHGLGVAPQLIITKCRGATSDWGVYHASVGATAYLRLNLTNVSSTGTGPWNNTAPTGTVFSVGTNAATNTANTMIAYCFAPVAGLSSYGTYQGNGSSDGPFVYTGFRPRWIMIKASAGGATQWFIYDTARNTSNVGNFALYASDATAETSILLIDILSNGFKLRYADTGGYTNYAGWTYIYAAFAESSFAYSRAR